MEHRAIVTQCMAPLHRFFAGVGFLWLSFVLLVSTTASWAQAQAVGAALSAPPLQAYVNDFTGTLTPQQQQLLEFELAAFERRTGSPIAILIVATTRPETIEQYSIRVADEWGLGHSEPADRHEHPGQTRTGETGKTADVRGRNDGILILVAKNDRRIRLEIGAALKRLIPDIRAQFIVEESIMPRFRTGDYAGGLRLAVDDLLHQIGHETLAQGRAVADSVTRSPPGLRWPLHSVEWPLWWMAAFLAGLLLRSFIGRLPGSLTGALLGAGALSLGGASLQLAGLGGALLLVVLLTMIRTDFPVTQTSRYTWRSGYGGLPGNWQDGFGIGGLGGNGSRFSGGGASGRW